MSGLITRSKSTAALLSVFVLASTMLASGAIAAPASAGNSFEIPVVAHAGMMPVIAHHRVVRHRLPAGNSFEIPLVTGASAQVPQPQPFSAGNSFEIPLNGRTL